MQCFLCAQRTDYIINLKDNKDLFIFCYEQVLQVTITTASPQDTCSDCLWKLSDFYFFVKQCKQNFQSSISYNKRNHKINYSQLELIDTDEEDGDSARADDDIVEVPKSKLCQICGKQLTSYSKLVSHLKTHSSDFAFKCKTCNKVFVNKFTLTQHEKTHISDKPYKCDFCSKTFGQSNQLITHRKQHTGKDIICTICNRGFCRKSELKLHLRSHTGEMPYKCTDCDRRFRIASHLKDHEAIHIDTRQFVCTHCGAAFKRRSTLMEHEPIHSGEYKFKCALCGYGSYKKWSLTQHLKKYHK